MTKGEIAHVFKSRLLLLRQNASAGEKELKVKVFNNGVLLTPCFQKLSFLAGEELSIKCSVEQRYRKTNLKLF